MRYSTIALPIGINSFSIGDRVERSTKEGFYTHWAVYIGTVNGIPMFAENQKGHGVRLVSQWEFEQAGKIRRVMCFNGDYSRRLAIRDRALSRLGDSYSLFEYNCENFVNWVVDGKSHSPQVQNLAAGAAVVGLAFLISRL